MSSNFARSNFNYLTSPIVDWCIEFKWWLSDAWQWKTTQWYSLAWRKRPTWRSRLSTHYANIDAKKECRLDAAACKLLIDLLHDRRNKDFLIQKGNSLVGIAFDLHNWLFVLPNCADFIRWSLIQSNKAQSARFDLQLTSWWVSPSSFLNYPTICSDRTKINSFVCTFTNKNSPTSHLTHMRVKCLQNSFLSSHPRRSPT